MREKIFLFKKMHRLLMLTIVKARENIVKIANKHCLRFSQIELY